MANSLLPPNPCLLGILLVTKFDSEARVSFHYPPRLGEDDATFSKYFARSFEGGTTSSSSDENSSSSGDEDRILAPTHKPEADDKAQYAELDETGSASPEKRDGMTTPQRHARWDDLLGYNSGVLAKFLCPAASTHKKKFEVALDDKVLLGWPVFAKEDGQWRRRRRRRRQTKTSDEILNQGSHDIDGEAPLQGHEDPRETSDAEAEVDCRMQSADVGDPAQDMMPDEPSRQIKEHSASKTKDALSMFHIVFIMNPPPLEYHLRIKEMYDNIVKKLSRAMKWEQGRSNYVSKEATAIAASTKKFLKSDKTFGPNSHLQPLYYEIMSHSSLARGIANVYRRISCSEIAHVSLTPTLSLSLQIPTPASISVLPSSISPQLPGLWLTTATSIPIDDEAHISSSQLASHFGLLLLSDLHTILTDVNSTDSPLTAPLVHYLRVSKPTKSFFQISQSSGIALSDIQFLASHLIHWRRAQAIPPLHQRDIYIVSPNADMSKLASATSTFAKLHPTLPALPKILGMLSAAPRPYSTLIPSRDHKEAYMDILAWLFRGGWATQLRTFAWIRIPPHIVRTAGIETESDKQHPKPTVRADVHEDSLEVPQPPSSPVSSTLSSTHTAFPIGSSVPSTSPVLVSQPNHPNAVSSQQLSAVSNHILEVQGGEAQKAWTDCVKYFDGKHALEMIAVREGWKRKRVGELIAGWENLGILRRVRHW